MSDLSNYASTIDTTRLSTSAASAISTLVVGVSALNDKSSVMPLLSLLGEFVSKATPAKL